MFFVCLSLISLDFVLRFIFLFGYCLEFILNVLIDVSCDLQEAAAAGR